MRTIFKFLAVVVFISLASCTDNNEEIATENGEIINTTFGIDKMDSQNPGGGGEEDPEDIDD